MKLGHGYRVTGRKGSLFLGRVSRHLCPAAHPCWWPHEQTQLEGARGERETCRHHSVSLQLPYMVFHMGRCALMLPIKSSSSGEGNRDETQQKLEGSGWWWGWLHSAPLRPSSCRCHRGKRHHLPGDKEASQGLLEALPDSSSFQPLHTTHGSNSLFPTDCPDMSWKQSDFPSLSSLHAAGEVKSSSAPSFL